jgi:hypothetical protein
MAAVSTSEMEATLVSLKVVTKNVKKYDGGCGKSVVL